MLTRTWPFLSSLSSSESAPPSHDSLQDQAQSLLTRTSSHFLLIPFHKVLALLSHQGSLGMMKEGEEYAWINVEPL